ncbi:AI-2E family transporter [Trueperella pecoris]|uniref:AI-2E family transporter n=1 Tax=Trueperella pecoris TaxID=2733571 RepID=A0A7M1QRY3_9ACTO|nr:AI-2E family transporter [Trueperella pecoris]QOQ38678.1 AI-2E family transporter [Trueperella pecoris]QOR44830.1 AI-2E family transporter [Trueperella pecoris]QTG74753.1 AI-2E family transporter [Trueperella pecoris]
MDERDKTKGLTPEPSTKVTVSSTRTTNVVEHRSPVPAALETTAGWAWRIIVITIMVVGMGWVAFRFSLILVALMIALLIAVVLEPMTSALKNRWNWPPAAAAAVGVVGLVLVILGLLIGAGTGIVAGVSDLADQVKEGMSALVDLLIQKFPHLQDTLSEAWAKGQKAIQDNASSLIGGVAAVGASVTSFLTGLVLTLFSLFFFLKDGRRLWHWIVRLTPRSQHNRVNEAGIRAWVTIGNYTRTQAIVAVVDAVGIAIVAMALRTPLSLAFPIGVVVFLFAFIPIVGAFLSGFLAVLIVLVNTQSVPLALLMLAGVILIQQIEGNVLQPILQGNALNMHALAIVLIVAGGSAVAGIFGALFAVPLAAAINTAILYLRGHDIYPYLNKMENRPGGRPRDFTEYSAEHWQIFDEQVAQHLTPKERRARRKGLPEETEA